MSSENLERDIEAGLARLERIASRFDADLLAEAGELTRARQAAEQPWLIAGVSDGIGLHTTLAALEAGVMKYGLGVYWEPPHFLELEDDGTPVSPVHYARYQNALALEHYAERLGATLDVVSADVIMAPQRGLKGDAKGEPSEFSAEVDSAFERIRARAPADDIVFVDSVAFGKWISPREGEDAITVPTVDFEGRLIDMSTKKYHPRGYQETLDTMGRNHGLLLEAIREFGWLGPDAVTTFFTWAGGSQNVDVLEGIYGKGGLGDAKVIAERDVAAFRLEHGLDLGAHAIVRLPAFLSAALMGIPGGGLFGLISRQLLEEKGHFEEMPALAARMLRRLFGPEWIRENPISQIELDHAECLYIDEIKERVATAHQRIADYRAAQSEDERGEPIPVEESRRLLRGLAPSDYPEILGRFRPELEGPSEVPESEVESGAEGEAETSGTPLETSDETGDETSDEEHDGDAKTPRRGGAVEFALDADELGEAGRMPHPDRTLVTVLEHLHEEVDTDEIDRLSLEREEVLLENLVPTDATRLTGKFVVQNGGNHVIVTREFAGDDGTVLAAGQATYVSGAESLEEPGDDGQDLGEALGYAMPVREPLETVYGDAQGRLGNALKGPALISFAEKQLADAGILDETPLPSMWQATFGDSVEVGDRLLTYARRDGDALLVTVVNEDSRRVLQLKVK